MTEKMKPVAYQAMRKETGQWVNLPEDWSETWFTPGEVYRALYTADQVKELTDRARNGALEEAAMEIENSSENDLGRQICCNGHMCGCQGSTVGQYAAYLIRTLSALSTQEGE